MSSETLFDRIGLLLNLPMNLLGIYILSSGWHQTRSTIHRIIYFVFPIFLLMEGILLWETGYGWVGRMMVYFLNLILCLCLTHRLSGSSILQSLFVCVSSSLSTLTADTIGLTVYPEWPLLRLVVKLLVFLAILFLVQKFVQRPFVQVASHLQKEWYPLIAIALSLTLALFWVQLYAYSLPSFLLTITLFSAISFLLLALGQSLGHLMDNYRTCNDNDLLQTHLASLTRHLDTIRRVSEQVRAFEHDMRHYLRMQSLCLENGDIQGAMEILESMDSKLEGNWNITRMRIYTRHSLIDAALSYYADRAQKHGVDLTIEIELPKHSANLMEFSVVLSNALENAITACEKQATGAARQIRLSGRHQMDQYFLEIRNTFTGSIEFDRLHRPFTRVPGHGYGTQSIVAFSNQHNGTLEYQVQDGWFTLRLLFEDEVGVAAVMGN